MSEMIFLGAGASVEAGVPDTYGMTSKISEVLRNGPYGERYGHVISFVMGGLLFQHGIRGVDPLQRGVNVEELFNAVQLLAERNTLEAAPFVGSWHAMVQELDRARLPMPRFDRLYRLIYEGVTKEILNALPDRPPSFANRDIDRELEDAIRRVGSSQSRGYSSTHVGERIGEYVIKITSTWMERLKRASPRAGSQLDSEFRRAVVQLRDKPGDGEIFAETAELMIGTLANIVWIDRPERVSYLKPLLTLAKTQGRLSIATLNYDNSVELLASTAGLGCMTGIDEWSKSGVLDSVQDGIFLLKLHGSIDWALDRDQRAEGRPMPHSVIRRVGVDQMTQQGFRPAVIFGQRNKLTAEGPFLDLLRAFQEELSRCNILTVIGYSFRDDHVNEYVSQWINRSVVRKMRIIDPGLDMENNAYVRDLLRLGVDRVEVFQQGAADTLSVIYPTAAVA